MITLNRVDKSYAGKPVLRDVSLSLAGGQTHVLIGASGSGKTTVLRLLLGLTPAEGGELSIDGLAVNAANQRAIAARVGYVVQEGGLFPHLNAEENVGLVARTLAWSHDRIAQRIGELTSLVQLDRGSLKRYPAQLSGGQRQRVGLMRAMFLDPAVYLLDEPLGALDPLVRAELQRELKRIFNILKKTVVLVTHDLAEAAFFGHTISLLHAGRVLQTGTFSDLVRRPASAYVTDFLQAVKPPAELKELL